MARTSRSMLSGPRLLVTASCLAGLLAVLPPRWIRWVSALSNPVVVLLGPMNKAMGYGVGLVTPSRAVETGRTPEQDELFRQVEAYKQQWLGVQSENERLRRIIAELQKVPVMSAELMRPVYAPIIGGGADLSAGVLKAKAGSREGVIPNSVAVMEGVHLVGRVTVVHSRYCLIQPIVQPSSPALRGVIMVGDTPGPFCELLPMRGGSLRGRVFFDEGPSRPELKPGMEVRLDDPEWPSGARMLIIGKIVEAVPHPQQPNRPVITVEPFYPIEKASEVIIRVPEDQGEGKAGGTP